MYLQIDESGYQFVEEQPENRAYIGIFTYDMMQEQARLRKIPYHVLEDARRFGFARYDSFENYDCISLEMPDFHNILISHGSVVIYLEKNYALFFTSKAQHVRHVLRDCAEGLGERISFQRLIYLFLETQTKEEEARRLGADGIVGIRFSTSAIMQGAAEVMAYGTAVKFK